MKSKEMRSYIESRLTAKLELLGFSLCKRPKGSMRFLKKVKPGRTQCVALSTGSMFGATICIHMHMYFEEVSKILAQLLLRQGLTAKQLELGIVDYTGVYCFMLEMALPKGSDFTLLYPKSIEEADRDIEYVLSILAQHALPRLEQLQTISSLVYALEHPLEGFNGRFHLTLLATPIVYCLGGRRDKALAWLERSEFQSEGGLEAKSPFLGYVQFGKNAKKWIVSGAPVDFNQAILN